MCEMLTATEILERYEGGEHFSWSLAYADKVCKKHGLSVYTYLNESAQVPLMPHELPTHVNAADLLQWMGY
jgi:hypothetical protein